MSRTLVAALAAVNLVAATYVAVTRIDPPETRAQAAAVSATSTTEPAPPPTTTTEPPTTTTLAPTTTTAPPGPAADHRLAPFVGLGTWVDVFDFSPNYMQEGEPTPEVTFAQVDAMAAAGVRTIYIQAARDDERTIGDLESPTLLAHFLTRAHEHGMRVVAWYLPKLYDESDLRRLRAIRDFEINGQRFDGIGLDIEFRAGVPDVAERNRRLVDLSRRLREEVGDYPLAAIVVPPVVKDVVNLQFWPAFPWTELAPYFDVWMPMAYWTDRQPGSEWRDARHYIETNVNLIRQHLGDPDAVVHAVGGIGDEATAAEYEGFVAAAHATGSIGGSIYDFRTTSPEVWPILAAVPG